MNKIYRSIWNASTQTWTAAQENAHAHGKHSARRALTVAMLAAVAALGSGGAWATPAPGGQGNTGIFVNDVSTGGCIAAYDAGSGTGGGQGNQWFGINANNYPGQLQYCSAGDKATQTKRVLFYGATVNDQDPGIVGSDSLTLGNELYVNGGRIVLNDQIRGTGSLAIGNEATFANGANSVAIGNRAFTAGAAANSIAIGAGAQANAANSVALGANSVTSMNAATEAYAPTAEAMAKLAGLTPVGEVSVGSSGVAMTSTERRITNLAAGAEDTDAVNVSQLKSVADLIDSNSTHYYSVNDNGTPQGNYSNEGAIAPQSLAAGVNASVSSSNSVAMGDGATVSTKADSSVAVGSEAKSNARSSVAVGANAVVGTEATNSVALGSNSAVAAGTTSATALGSGASVNGVRGVAVGSGAQSLAANTVAIGAGAVASGTNDVALGRASVANGAVGTSGASVGGKSVTFAGATPQGTVSVGVQGSERTITNVAAGRLSGTSTDAINGSQLHATNQVVDEHAMAITDLDGRVTTVEGGVTRLGDTITNIAGDTSETYTNANGIGIRYARTNEQGLAKADAYASGEGSTAVGYEAAAQGNSSLALGRNAMAAHANSVALGSNAVTDTAFGTAGGTVGGVYRGYAGSAPVGTVSVGGADSERTITNVAAGRVDDQSTDAINGSQLHATNLAVNKNTSDITNLQGDIGNAVMYDSPARDSVTLGGPGASSKVRLSNVAEGEVNENSTDAINGSQLYQTRQSITNLDGRVTNVEGDITNLTTNIDNVYMGGTKYFHANSTGVDSQAVGQDSVAIGMGARANHANDVALGAGSSTSYAVSTPGAVFGNSYYNFAGANPTGTVSVGAQGSERTITNVAAGQVSADSTDAINGSQLYAVGQAIGDLNASVTQATEGTVKYDRNPDGTINYNSITLQGEGGEKTSIHNVATGVEGSDAVNVDQLNQAVSGITDNLSAAANPFFTADGDRNAEAASATGDHATAMGANAQANAANSVAVGAGSVADRANTVSVGTAGNERQITNVAPGTVGTDAVNLNQLNNMGAQANQYTDKRVNMLGDQVNRVARDAYSGVAAATALSMIPDVDLGKSISVGVGGGTYRGYQAMAIGGTARVTQNIKLRAGAGVSSGGTTVGVGASYQW
ncbi:YadA family autotransporter adhesin [Paraburkholderia tropica]|uniref:YadA family autotransporter adhesin n=1 Tax=Paraburkholderia tropica TaxID=92647 RepID=UPI002AB6E2C9|nr:YadA-like family protein [Paraburkholderia tropica]